MNQSMRNQVVSNQVVNRPGVNQGLKSLLNRQVDAHSDHEQEAHQYLTFMLGAEVFAIGILHIKEIIEYGKLTTVPMMPDFIRGVINLRGAVVPVIDLSRRFGGMRSQISRRSCIIILELHSDEERHVIGVVVDAVNEVLDIQDAEIEAAPAFGTSVRSDFIAGMGRIQESFVIILDVNNVLSGKDLNLLTELEHSEVED
ncbi:MAG: chemotaxis protein CheW [Gammaproteobacteria bacterium]|nr:chemotaxis protein CheW [Gammaproteobacteria bacterium]